MEFEQAQEALRSKLIAEAMTAAREYRDRGDVLAAILTGSAAWGRPNPDGDLDILLITRGSGHVYYRYLIPEFCPVARRTELGFIPLDRAEGRIDERYATTISCSMIEQLKHGRVLFEKHGRGELLIESSRRAEPGSLVVGELISSMARALRESQEQAGRGEHRQAVFLSREAGRFAARILLLAREKTGVSKEKHEYRAIKAFLRPDEARRYEEALNIAGLTEQKARTAVERTADLLRWVLSTRSVSPGLAEYA